MSLTGDREIAVGGQSNDGRSDGILSQSRVKLRLHYVEGGEVAQLAANPSLPPLPVISPSNTSRRRTVRFVALFHTRHTRLIFDGQSFATSSECFRCSAAALSRSLVIRKLNWSGLSSTPPPSPAAVNLNLLCSIFSRQFSPIA